MTSIEDRFVAAVEDLAVPRVDLSTAILRQLPATPTRRVADTDTRLRMAMAAVVAVAIAGGLMLAFGPTRRAVADWLGIGATAIEVDAEQSRPDDGQAITDGSATARADDPVADDPGADPPVGPPSASSLGAPIEFDAAIATVPIDSLGPPDGVFDDDARGRSFVWATGPGLPALAGGEAAVVLSVREVADAGLALKSVAARSDVDIVVVDRDAGPVSGLWIGVDHDLLADGRARPVEAGRVLLWEADGVEYRLETDLSLEATLELARSVGDGTTLLAAG